MSNQLIEQKSWWKKNWKWLVPLSGILLISMAVFFSSKLGGISADIAQAYADTALYDNALIIVKSNEKVIDALGNIQPIDKLAILEGEVAFSNDYKAVNTTIRIIGTLGKARMDLQANRINNEWIYTNLQVRIKNPTEKKKTIVLIKTP